MPYIFSTKVIKGQKRYCMRSKDTGKQYCYSSEKARMEGAKIHEMFKHMPRSKIRIAK